MKRLHFGAITQTIINKSVNQIPFLHHHHHLQDYKFQQKQTSGELRTG